MSETLTDLLRAARTRLDMSGRRLADHAAAHGHPIDRTQVNAILAGTYKSRPSARTVRAVAFLAGVEEEQAFAAAGLPLPGPDFAQELPPDADRLTPTQRKAVITVIRAFLEDEEHAAVVQMESERRSADTPTEEPQSQAANDVDAIHGDDADEPRPIAARRGESQGRRARRQQDEAGEVNSAGSQDGA